MTVQLDLRVTHLLCSRLCHDLISPASAVKTGVEFMLDEESGMGDDALALLENSAGQLNAKLTFFRSAFGRGGEADSLTRVRDLLLGWTKGGKVQVDWPMETGDLVIGREPARLLLNLLLLALDTVQSQAVLTVRLANLAEGIGVAIAVEGRGVRFREDLVEAMSLATPLDTLTPRSVQAYFTWQLAEDLGTAVERNDDGNGRIEIATLLPLGG